MREGWGYSINLGAGKLIDIYVLRIHVVDKYGNGVSGALVTVYLNGTAIFSRHTDTDGYAETIVTAGKYRIVAEHYMYMPVTKDVYVDNSMQVDMALTKSKTVLVARTDIVVSGLLFFLSSGAVYIYVKKYNEFIGILLGLLVGIMVGIYAFSLFPP